VSHFKEVCQYGFTHGQCRCRGPKEEHKVECDNSNHANILVKPEVDAETQGHVDAAIHRYETETKPFIEEHQEPERVNHPQHYNNSASGVECIEVVRWMTFDVGNAVKYLWRLGHKDDSVIELRKAEWYLKDQLAFPAHHDSVRVEDYSEWASDFKAHIATVPDGHVQMALKFILGYYDLWLDSTKRLDNLRLAVFEISNAITKASLGNDQE